MVKKLLMYVGPCNVISNDIRKLYMEALSKKKLKDLSTIFSLQTVFCYQCVEL